MNKTIKIITLPTKEKTNIIIDRGRLEFIQNKQVASTINNIVEGYHLYFLSDEEIQEGEWVMYFTSPMFCFKVNEESVWLRKKDGNSKLVGKEECSRIIATTDESLEIISKGINPVYEKLPKPSNEFLKKYCELGGIDECLVEYEPLVIIQDYANTPSSDLPPMVKMGGGLKINLDNTVSIY